MRVLVLGTYRDSELSQSHALLDTLACCSDGTMVSAASNWPGSMTPA